MYTKQQILYKMSSSSTLIKLNTVFFLFTTHMNFFFFYKPELNIVGLVFLRKKKNSFSLVISEFIICFFSSFTHYQDSYTNRLDASERVEYHIYSPLFSTFYLSCQVLRLTRLIRWRLEREIK